MINIKQMFSRYYVGIRPRTNEFHHIHKEGCPFLPEEEKRICLGSFISGNDALLECFSYYQNSECCSFCIKEDRQMKSQFNFAEIEYALNTRETATIVTSYDDALYSFTN